ncbi:hypothetical protein GXM_06784 [Nostoc sphaeroides CCNUC1]|uniref:Uncharacterized protein n=1 Tax=Nostoc sphaeroides CCNUC1 TaxID=2653204 RepID=A0A5P8W9F1_9NOSO|nr:hypothetical protein GXM_06784 [Nostoc sphaeroides CCNUC1]
MSPECQNKDFEEVIINSLLSTQHSSSGALYVKLRSLSKDKLSNLIFTLGKKKQSGLV